MADPEEPLGREARQLAIAAASVFEDEIDHLVAVAIRKRLRLPLLRLTIVYFTVLLVAVGAVWAISRNANNDRVAAASGECQRVQVLRDELNRFIGAVYGFVDAARRARQGDYERNHSKSDRYAVAAYTSIEASIFYLPPTNCHHAVRGVYPTPQPIPYGDAVKRKLVPTPPGLEH